MPQDWIWGLAGGGVIGIAAALFLLCDGRIMGASGLIGDIVDGSAGRRLVEDGAFVAALILVPAILVWFAGGAQTHASPDLIVMAVGGVCVGFGTRLANGCTSGHGVCGISRLAPRGIVATLIYIGAGVVTLALLRHVWPIL